MVKRKAYTFSTIMLDTLWNIVHCKKGKKIASNELQYLYKHANIVHFMKKVNCTFNDKYHLFYVLCKLETGFITRTIALACKREKKTKNKGHLRLCTSISSQQRTLAIQ